MIICFVFVNIIWRFICIFRWANFTLNVDPDTTGTFVNETGHTGKLVLTYKGLSPSGPANETGKLNKASITCVNFSLEQNVHNYDDWNVFVQFPLFHQTRLLVRERNRHRFWCQNQRCDVCGEQFGFGHYRHLYSPSTIVALLSRVAFSQLRLHLQRHCDELHQQGHFEHWWLPIAAVQGV